MTDRSRTETARALRKLAAFLDATTDEDFDGFIRGSLSIELVRRNREIPEPSSTKDEESLIATLQASASREEALDLLRAKKRSRAELAQLARHLQIHVEKHDKIDLVEEKIVENVIGARLRSGAIQGLSLKGSSTESAPRSDQEGESPASSRRVSKDAPSPSRNGSVRRTLTHAQRDGLRNKLTEFSSELYTSTRDADWWLRRFEASVPEIVEGVRAAVAAHPHADELRRNARTLTSRLDGIKARARKGEAIGIDETQSVGAALTEVAGALMSVSVDS